MTNIIIDKPSKKIKVKLTSINSLEVIGPLGTLELKDKDFQSFTNSSLFIPKRKMNIIINDIKKSFIGVSRG